MAAEITRVRWKIWTWALLLCASCFGACAQDVQFLPEIDVHVKLNSVTRVYVQAKDDREGGDPQQLSIGPSVQLYVKPLVRLKEVTTLDLDDAKSRFLVLDTGYRAVAEPDTPLENRMVVAATSHFPLQWKFLLSERNRADLDWKSGSFTWRYRNCVTLQRGFLAHSLAIIPYAAAEPFYESQYGKWSTTDLYAGALLPLRKRYEFNLYYEHENNTGKKPNQSVNEIGLALYMFFSREKK